MRYFAICLLTALLTALGNAQGTRISTTYAFPPEDTVLSGLGSIRAVAYHPDVDGDGLSEIIMTNYNAGGTVHVFEAVGNDSIRLVWTAPIGGTGVGDSPRFATFGDLDNDGLFEVIYQLSGTGVLIFEWDGVTGSDNYGTTFSALVGSPPLSVLGTRYTEQFFVEDIDGDGSSELVLAYDSHGTGSSTATDTYYIIHALGDWTTNDPGFSGFGVEMEKSRTDLTAWGGGGSPTTMIPANLDGTGPKELILHNWNHKNVTPIRNTGLDTWSFADTTNGKQQIYLTGPDNWSIFGGMAADIDRDGREEVYLADLFGGLAHMISYNAGESTSEIDLVNVTEFDLTGFTDVLFGFGYGDIDANGKPNIYLTSALPNNVISLEFQGGDKRNVANWTASVIYPGDSTGIEGDPDESPNGMTISDSSGVVDTSIVIDLAFVSKPWARGTDFDKDGYEDILMPYQAFSDSFTVRSRTWNPTTQRYDTTSVTRQLNPDRRAFRILEGTALTGVEMKDLTVIMPDDFRLEQNYPNPFNPSTTISFYLPVKSQISVRIYDMLGKEVRTLIDNQAYPAGTASVSWDGRNSAGKPASSGTYFYSLIYGNFRLTQKMMLLK